MREPITIDPGQHAGWRATHLGAVTERLELNLVFRLAGPLRGVRVLDVGAGDGTYAMEAASRGADVTGVDADPAMLRLAQEHADARCLALSITAGRAEELPFADETFDVVFAVTVLCFVSDAASAVREIARVLVPGGRLVIGELGRFSTWAALRRLRGWLGSTTWRRARFRSAGELRGLLRGAGLTVQRVTGAIYYPPLGVAARFLAPFDPAASELTTLGAAFLTAAARKPQPNITQGEQP